MLSVVAAAQQTEILVHDSRRSTGESALVTVCVSLFDYERYVIECLDSVRDQTLSRISLTVLDDGSTDGGPDRVRSWMERYPERFVRLRLLRSLENRGLAAARNTAVADAESPFVLILDADNLIYPRCCEVLLQAVESSQYAFAYPILEQFGAVQRVTGCDSWSPEFLARGNYIDALALLRRDAWERVGGYRKMQTPGWEDYDFWCRCVEADLAGVSVPEILARYRVHSRSMLRRSTDTLRNHLQVCREITRAHPWLVL